MKLLPIDFHSHIDPTIERSELVALDAVLFAATPSLAEAARAMIRHDNLTIWGVGCHPNLVRSQKAFELSTFVNLLDHTPFVSEIGLDGDSRVPLARQVEVLQEVLGALQSTPRIHSVHSYRATAEVLETLQQFSLRGSILHWWLGTPDETRQAVKVGCYFSVNASSARNRDLLASIPLARLLTETDHPSGDRFGRAARPGNVRDVEVAIAQAHSVTPDEVREHMWKNLDRLVSETGVERLLPKGLRVRLSAL